MIETGYYEDLKQQIFRSGPVGAIGKAPKRGEPHARFHFDRSYDDAERFVIYDFVTDLYGMYGKRLDVGLIVDGCIMLTLEFESTANARGVDFRKIIEDDSRYHDVFRRYLVTDVYFQWFPKTFNKTHYKIAPTGRPEPV